MIRSILFAAWAIASTVVYGIGVLTTALFSRRAARWIGRQWSKHLLAAGGVRVRAHGLEKLKRNGRYIIISNHASAFDIPVLIACLPLNLVFMAKKELFRIPFFGWGISVLGHIPVDRSRPRKARESISTAAARIHCEDIALLLFPEGTRSVTGELAEFKSASFALALESEVDITPVLLSGTHRILGKKSLKVAPGTVDVFIGDTITAADAAGMGKKELSERVFKKIQSMKQQAG